MSTQVTTGGGADAGSSGSAGGAGRDAAGRGTTGKLAVAWSVVGIPLAYGVYETAKKAAVLFTG